MDSSLFQGILLFHVHLLMKASSFSAVEEGPFERVMFEGRPQKRLRFLRKAGSRYILFSCSLKRCSFKTEVPLFLVKSCPLAFLSILKGLSPLFGTSVPKNLAAFPQNWVPIAYIQIKMGIRKQRIRKVLKWVKNEEKPLYLPQLSTSYLSAP